MKKAIVYVLVLLVLVPAVGWGASAYNIGGNTPRLGVGGGTSLAAAPRMRESSGWGDGVFPVGVGLLPPLQVPVSSWDILIARVNIFWGKNHNVSFFDIGGLATQATGDMRGFQVGGLWNQVMGNVGGVQVGGVGNFVGGDFTGVQVGGVANYQDGAGVFNGVQVASLFNAAGGGTGLQVGLVNYADSMVGAQIGLVNTAKNLSGVQVGLFNYIEDSTVPLMMVLNVGF